MRSTAQQLVGRGFVSEEECEAFCMTAHSQFLLEEMLLSDVPKERTLAATALGRYPVVAVAECLCRALEREKALYAKIAIQRALVGMGRVAVVPLINRLGTIGNNQHKVPNNEDIGKTVYPLARDIAARTLCQIGTDALPELKGCLETGTRCQKLEAIDAIGHILSKAYWEDCEVTLIKAYNSAEGDPLLQWKLIKAMQSLRCKEAADILENWVSKSSSDVMGREAERSLKRMASYDRNKKGSEIR